MKVSEFVPDHCNKMENQYSVCPGKSAVCAYLVGLLADVRDCVSENLFEHYESAQAIKHLDDIQGYLRDAAMHLSLMLGDEMCESVGLGDREEE